jgi:hypothetical protein
VPLSTSERFRAGPGGSARGRRAATASTAGAANWRSNGGSFTGNPGRATFDINSVILACNTATIAGTMLGTIGPVYPSAWNAASGTLQYDSCAVGGTDTTRWHCSYALTATSHAPNPSGAHPFSNESTSGGLSLVCTVYNLGVLCKQLAGAAPAVYTNPAATGGTGRLAPLTGVPLTVTGGPSCLTGATQVILTGLSIHIPTARSIWVL